jgi:chromosome segregation ATPase
MSETDPWKVAKSTIRARIADYSVALLGHSSGSQQAKENAQTAIDVAIDAARAAEAAQHQQALRAGDAEIEACKREIARLTQEPFRLAQVLSEARARVAAVEAERDRLKAALSQITALDFEKFNGRHNFYSGAAMFVKAWLLAYAALTPQGQSTDGETR